MKISSAFTILMTTCGYLSYAAPSWASQKEIPSDSLQRIILIPKSSELSFFLKPSLDFKPELNREERPVFSRVSFLNEHPEFLKRLEIKYLKHPITENLIESLKKTVIDFYDSKGYKLIKVSIPEQQIKNGTLFVVVEEADLGKIIIDGNRHVSEKSIRRKIRAKEGEPLNFNQLKEDLSWINNSAFRQATAILSPGSQPNSTDLKIEVQTRRSYRFYTGADNTGTHTTGKVRLFAVVNFGNLFGLDQRLSYQFTTGTTYDQFHSHTVDYVIPFPWRHFLRVYGGYSSSRPHLSDENLRMTGQSWQIDPRYEIPLNRTSNGVLQQLTWGFDFKRMNNDFEFGGEEVQSQYVNVIQAVLEYQNGFQNARWKSNWELAIYGSPGGIGNDNTTKAFRTLRPLSKSSYRIFG
ncbi:MAG: ShlB/FhaC/HecB family hemolysin secretion/activation protein, partial [Chlamydiales bacterium]|nr:ShlB/FhaC/HecB family hemolysin secretion/activation protein [Chlamydiales bacterium]